MRRVIDRALVQGPLRRHEEYVALERALCGHIEALLPHVAAATARLPRGTVDRYRRRAWLDGVHVRLAHGLGDGLVSAHTQVTALARDCRTLLHHYRAQQRNQQQDGQHREAAR